MDFDKREITFERTDDNRIKTKVKADKVIAADGLYSMVRR
jgi:2-polyprenyl-6-methoxyphenol hydroxylase-like FAD-dependent oxidoreductase